LVQFVATLKCDDEAPSLHVTVKERNAKHYLLEVLHRLDQLVGANGFRVRPDVEMLARQLAPRSGRARGRCCGLETTATGDNKEENLHCYPRPYNLRHETTLQRFFGGAESASRALSFVP
jgi:hypothetical protein